MKIGIYVRCLGRGGAEKTAANLSIELSKDHEVDIIVHEPLVEYKYSGNLINIGIDYQNSSGFLKFFKVLKFLNKNIKRLKKENKYDAVISFMESSNLSNVQTRVAGTKNIISVRNHRSTIDKMRGIKGRILKYLTKKHYNKADLIVACSKDVKEDLIQNYNLKEEKIIVIYNPLDNELISSYQTCPNLLDKNKFNIVNVGRLEPQKGQWHLIRAMEKILEVNNDVVLHILGRGEYEEKLKKLVTDLGLNKNVIFHGFSSEVYNFLNNCDISVVSSLFEGIPNSITESFAAGLPVISTNCKTGPRELLAENILMYNEKIDDIIDCESGILIPAFTNNLDFYNVTDYDAKVEDILSNAVIKLFDKDILSKYSEKALQKSKLLDKKNIIKKWTNILK